MIKKVLLLLFTLYVPTAWGAIYDCFLFYNELDLLEIRLEELSPHVDKFVLVECAETFTGKEKPLYFAENKHRYEKFLPQIIHVVVQERLNTDNPWERESFQRNQIMQGLVDCKNRDIILISDVDEIPKGTRLSHLIQPILSRQATRTGSSQRLFFYFLNRYASDRIDWNGTTAVQFHSLLRKSPQYFREHRGDSPIISDMGWHFTWMGGPRHVVAKAYAQSHTEYTTNPHYTQEELFEHLYKNLSLLPLTPDNFPRFIVDHQEYLRGKGLLEKAP